MSSSLSLSELDAFTPARHAASKRLEIALRQLVGCPFCGCETYWNGEGEYKMHIFTCWLIEKFQRFNAAAVRTRKRSRTP